MSLLTLIWFTGGSCSLTGLLIIPLKKKKKGVPAMVQWVKNLTVVAQVAVKLQVQSLTWGSGLKDVVLPQLQLRFNLWRRNLHMLQVWP